MNPYAKHRENLLAAKERLRQHTNFQQPKRPFQPYAQEKLCAQGRVSSRGNLERRVGLVRRMSGNTLERSLHTREIQAILGVQNLTGAAKNRALNTVLATAGKKQLKKQTVGAIKLLRSGHVATVRVRDEPYLTMLEIAGIIEAKKFHGGGQQITIKDKERLKRTIDEEKIVW